MAKVVLTTISTVLIFTAVTSASVGGDGAGESRCICGVFPEDSQMVPLIEQPLEFGVSCDAEGSAICQSLCIALAQGAKDQAPALICEKLDKRVENFKVAVFTKTTCDVDNEWKSTGLKSPEGICCEDGKESVCGSGTTNSA